MGVLRLPVVPQFRDRPVRTLRNEDRVVAEALAAGRLVGDAPLERPARQEPLELMCLVRVTRAETRPHYSIHRTSSTPSISATPATTAGAEPPLVSSTSTATERRSPSCATSSDTTRPLCRSIAS